MTKGIRLTELQITAVAESLEITPAWRAAANHAGIHEDTVHAYRRLAANYDKRHETDQNLQDETDPDWWQWQAVQQWNAARNRLELRLVQGVLDAIPKDWKAAHAMLKSGWPQDYSDRVELTGAGGGPVQISTDEARAQLEASLAAVKAKREAAGTVVDGEALDAATTIEEVEAAVAIPPPAGG